MERTALTGTPVTTKSSRFSYADTVAELTRALVASGNTIFATIDQAAAAVGVGMTLRPTTLIVFGNPKGGTPLMEAFPIVALELPLKLLGWDDNGIVSVAYVPMSTIAAQYSVKGMDARIEAMDRALDTLTNTIT
jgi:uncharacterized protein (DUF302 family)